MRRKVEQKNREDLANGEQLGVRPEMKRNNAPRSGVLEDIISKWGTYEDRHMKRLGIKDTSSNNSDNEVLGNESCTLWLLQYVAHLKEDREHYP